MSEQPTARPSGGRILGMPRTTFYLAAAGTAIVAGLALYWYRNYKAAKSTAATQATTSTATTDYGGELSVLQSELEALLQQQGTGTTTATGTTTTTGTGTTDPGPPVTVAVPNGSGGWMNYTFPSNAALYKFYSLIGVVNGAYPNGIGTQQFLAALQQVGAVPASSPSGGGGDRDRDRDRDKAGSR